jgi:chromosome segregation ATPase|mmetsp:Transcript_12639/g.22974  ORF Transcript_12639/g.22974 Transcript_12639/m.22974 type:complete len:593 (+) Transcript_12639:108-1886(+)|eukprot:CAMPEP_0174293170 /NCGR_PEP_ID=MMETSP0809-20121228/37727_1 /TAXON_ID=73025 ORGANISM="Eutreptiella gymnastica-like, Strain CCMP1594" /NCGR_SAMPLE_ID=MMETSP0809 /ASSEMBLY_ACC=CAM_ASM_000658 /LENGTH=592 /DNA_ID=CAMNT_0015393761 /DNA_START=108 /DNA_END=1886 /DNA_ORIENTATION=+
MPPKEGKKGGKKGKKSKEDQERLAREEEERAAWEQLKKAEAEAEERQQLENELRDKLEYKEKKRLKKEAQAAAMAEKDAAIMFLTKSLNDLNRNHESMKTEMEDELERMTHIKEVLENEMSQVQTEHDQQARAQTDEREATKVQMMMLHDELEDVKRQKEQVQQELRTTTGALNKDLTKVTAECQLLRDSKEKIEKELSSELKTQREELKKSTDLNKMLQEVIETREEEDKKNVYLMQLLNTQLEDQKTRFEGLLEDEANRNESLQKEVLDLKRQLLNVQAEKEKLEKMHEDFKRDSQAEINDVKAKLEQHKFDTKFLHSELNIYKSKLNKQQSEAEKFEQGAAKDVKTLRDELDEAERKLEQMAETLARKDRDHFDKVTFLNAQISNNRIALSTMHSKLQNQKESHLQELSDMTDKVTKKSEGLLRVQNASDKNTLRKTEAEVQMNTDLAALKTAVFQLQNALVEKERELNAVSEEKDKEIHRLRRKLDESFIPHRKDARERTQDGEATTTGDAATAELDATTKYREDVESRMTSQIENLNHIIESLQSDLRNKEDDSFIKMKLLSDENARLRKTLDTLDLDANFVPSRTF